MDATINSLPNEIIVDILTRINLYDRINCSQVCDRWQRLSHVYLSDIKAFTFGQNSQICSDSEHKAIDEKTLSQYHNNLCQYIDETSLLGEVLQLIPRLKSLHVSLRESSTVKIISKYCDDIECLTVASADPQVMLCAIPLVAKFAKTLRHLKINDMSRVIARRGLQTKATRMLSNCNQLKVLHLFGIQLSVNICKTMRHSIKEISTIIGSNSLSALIDSKVCDLLETLIIRQSFMNASRVQMICGSFMNLKKLCVETYCESESFTQLRSIGRLKHLEHLEINFTHHMSLNYICIDHEMIAIFNGCRNLIKIAFNNCLNLEISDDCLTQMSVYCVNISHIQLWRFGDMRRVTIDSIESLARLGRLSYLTLDAFVYNCDDNLTTAWTEKLLELNPNLDFIHLFKSFTKKEE